MRPYFSLLSAGLGLALTATLNAEQPSAGDARLREQLRATMLQLRTAETDRANLQAAQAEHEQKAKSLTEQVATLVKQSAADKETSDKAIAALHAKVDERDAEVARLNESLEKWKKGYNEAAALAQKKEAERTKLADKVIALDRQVADQQVRNAAMFKLGNEILSRYEKFGLGTALTAREPFVGITKVKLQSLFQDYQDKLADQRIKP